MVDFDVPLEQAAKLLEEFGVGAALTTRIATLEAAGQSADGKAIEQLLADQDFGASTLAAARTIKAVAGQVNVVIHAVGIMTALPWLLDPGETVESLSLGAGNTGRAHDLETNLRIAEFKFIDWRGGAESIRQNNLFADVFNVASAATSKRRIVYVLGTELPLKFLNGRRAIASVLSRSPKVRHQFEQTYGTQFATVRDYWGSVHEVVEILDLRALVPHLKIGS